MECTVVTNHFVDTKGLLPIISEQHPTEYKAYTICWSPTTTSKSIMWYTLRTILHSSITSTSYKIYRRFLLLTQAVKSLQAVFLGNRQLEDQGTTNHVKLQNGQRQRRVSFFTDKTDDETLSVTSRIPEHWPSLDEKMKRNLRQSAKFWMWKQE